MAIPETLAQSDLYRSDQRQSQWSCHFITNDLQSTPSRRGGAPSDLPPKLPLALDGLSSCRASRYSRLPSIANSRSSKHIPVPVPLSGFLPEPLAEVGSRLPRELDRSLSPAA